MTNTEANETKDRILIEAENMFAQFGYNGASVREISSRSGANIAAINYHFKNKEGLYWAVMEKSHSRLEQGIALIAETAKNMEELAVETFEFLLEEKTSLRNALKMMLSESVDVPSSGMEQYSCIAKPGPPGYEYFIPFIIEDVNTELKQGSVMFAVKAIFSAIVQWGMICSSPKMDVLKNIDATFSEAYFKEHIRHSVRATLSYTQTNNESLNKSLSAQ